MLTLLALALLASPVRETFPIQKPCAWWSRAEQRCRDADMEILGPWNPILNDRYPEVSTYGSEPREWGAFPLERERNE